eukprot:2027351-Pyramimonas_sp.AAC.1
MREQPQARPPHPPLLPAPNNQAEARARHGHDRGPSRKKIRGTPHIRRSGYSLRTHPTVRVHNLHHQRRIKFLSGYKTVYQGLDDGPFSSWAIFGRPRKNQG